MQQVCSAKLFKRCLMDYSMQTISPTKSPFGLTKDKTSVSWGIFTPKICCYLIKSFSFLSHVKYELPGIKKGR